MTTCCLPELRKRNHEILRLRLEERLVLEEISKKIGGITRERVSQIIRAHLPGGGTGRAIVRERFFKKVKCGYGPCKNIIETSIQNPTRFCSHECTIQGHRKFPWIDGKPRCFKCGGSLAFAKRPFLCRKCNTARSKAWRHRPGNMKRVGEISKRSESKDPRKRRAWIIVRDAVVSGKLKRPKYCEKCPEKAIQAHHDDYNKPLKVKWLCAFHHRRRHDYLRARKLSP